MLGQPELLALIEVGGTWQGQHERRQRPRASQTELAVRLLHLRSLGAPVTDAQAGQVRPLAEGPLPQAAEAVLRWLGIDDAEVTEAVLADACEMGGDG